MHARTSFAALAAAVLLSACVSPVPYNDRVPKTTTYQSLDAQLKPRAPVDRAQLEQLQNLVRLTLADALLFPEGGRELNPAGQARLIELAPSLKDLSGQRIVVKGFTDNVPPGPGLNERLAGNVELSKARAQGIAALLVAQGVPEGIVSSVGLGASHPVADNDTPEGRAQNNRVVIDVVDAPI